MALEFLLPGGSVTLLMRKRKLGGFLNDGILA